MNPARSLGPAFITPGQLNMTWMVVYIGGPLAGGIAAAYTYQLIFKVKLQSNHTYKIFSLLFEPAVHM